MITTRRTFLATLLGSPLARVLPLAPIATGTVQTFAAPLLPTPFKEPRFTDSAAWYLKTRPVGIEVFRRELEPALNEVFFKAYERHALSDEWKGIYGSAGL